MEYLQMYYTVFLLRFSGGFNRDSLSRLLKIVKTKNIYVGNIFSMINSSSGLLRNLGVLVL